MANLSDYQSYISSTRYDPRVSRATAQAWRHQVAMLMFALSRAKVIIYAGMGSGKTFFALIYMEHFDGLRLIICPRRAMPVWKADYAAFYAKSKPYELVVLDAGSAKDKEKILDDLKARKARAVVVVNYDTAALLPLHRYGFTASVADEAHRLGSYGGKQSRVLAKTCKDIPNKVAMTGSPYHDGYERLYGITRWLDPVVPARGYPQSKLFGTYNQFLDDFTKTWTKGTVRIIKGYKNLPELAALVKSFMLVIKTSEVIDLPEAVYRRYPVELAPATRQAYDSLKDDAIIEFDDGVVFAPHILTRIIRLQQLVSSGVLEGEDGERREFDISERLDALEGILEEIGERPVVISCRFKRDVQNISQLIETKFGITPHYLTGEVDNHLEWRDGAGRYLIMTVSAGSEGVRLERAADMVRYSRGWSLKQDEQGEARIRRYGQESKTVRYYDIVSEDTIDDAIYAALHRKSGDVQALDQEVR